MKDAISIGCELISSRALREAGHGHQIIWFLQKSMTVLLLAPARSVKTDAKFYANPIRDVPAEPIQGSREIGQHRGSPRQLGRQVRLRPSRGDGRRLPARLFAFRSCRGQD